MTFSIFQNPNSINEQRTIRSPDSSQTAMQRLVSGLRINSAKDDTVGLAIADRITSSIHGMNVAVRNTNDGLSLTQTAESALNSITETLQRMRDLAIQSANTAGITQLDRAKMQTEYKALNDEITRIVQNSAFNGKKVLNGDFSGGLDVQVGSTAEQNSRICIAISDMNAMLKKVKTSKLSIQGDSFTTGASSQIEGAKTQLETAKSALDLAKVAVNTARIAVASPYDVSLANAAIMANSTAEKISQTKNIQTLQKTDLSKALSLLNSAIETKVTATANLETARQNMYSIASDSLKTANDASSALTILEIAKSLTSDAYVEKTSKTSAENENAKSFFIKNNQLVVDANKLIDRIETDYSLSSIDAIDAAISAIDTQRSTLGSIQNRFSTTLSNLQNTIENQSATKSRIVDADIAKETAELSRSQILQRASIAMLAQANQSVQRLDKKRLIYLVIHGNTRISPAKKQLIFRK